MIPNSSSYAKTGPKVLSKGLQNNQKVFQSHHHMPKMIFKYPQSRPKVPQSDLKATQGDSRSPSFAQSGAKVTQNINQDLRMLGLCWHHFSLLGVSWPHFALLLRFSSLLASFCAVTASIKTLCKQVRSAANNIQNKR